MPGITGVNHITLTCSNLERSISFYCNLLDADLRATWQTGAYLELGALWLCLDVGPAHPARDYSHVALDCGAADFQRLSERIRAGATLWKDNRSEGASLYFRDPDGHRLELHVGSLQSRLQSYRGRAGTEIFGQDDPIA